MSAKDVIMPIQRWLLGEGRCSSCGEYLESQGKKKLNSHFVVTCVCSHAFEYWPKEHHFEKAYLRVGE